MGRTLSWFTGNKANKKVFVFSVFTVRYVRANVDFDHATKVNFSPDTR